MTDNQSQQTHRAFICAFYADPEEPFLSFEPIQWGTNIPLYTAPQQRKPLTDEQIDAYFAEQWTGYNSYHDCFKDVIRWAEAAHGIKE